MLPLSRIGKPLRLAALATLALSVPGQAAERYYFRNVVPSERQGSTTPAPGPTPGSNNGGGAVESPQPATPLTLSVSPWPTTARDLDRVDAAVSTTGAKGAVTYSVQGLPNALTFASGSISGQFLGTGSGSIVVTATDEAGSTSRTLAYTVHPRVPQVALTLPSQQAYPGDLYTATAYSSNSVANLTWSLAAAPGWLQVDATTGLISGRPPAGEASFTFTPMADNGFDPPVAGSAATVTLLKALAPKLADPVPTTLALHTPLPPLVVGSEGGVGQVSLSSTGNLPPGITVSPNGTISGTPYQAGTYTFTLTLTDSATPPHTVTVGTYTTTVASAPPTYDLAKADKALADFKAAMAARGFIYGTMSGGAGSAASKDYRRQIPSAFSVDSVGRLVFTDAAMRASAYQIYGGSGVGSGYQTAWQLTDNGNRLGGLAVPGVLYASQNTRSNTPVNGVTDASVLASDGLVIEFVDRANGYVYDLYYRK